MAEAEDDPARAEGERDAWVRVPLGHEARVRGLWRAARTGRLGHALLFEGPEGVGKFTAARWLTLGLLCARGVPDEGGAPCGACGPCKRVRAGSHPDLFVLDIAHEDVPEKERQEHVKLDRIVRREGPTAWKGPVVEEFLGLRAAEGGRRIVLIREAERLRHSQLEAQNAMLKMLEEPGAGVLFVLETSQPQALLATIRSRCVPVRFAPLDDAQVLAALGRDDPQAAALARIARGSPGRALDLERRGALQLRGLVAEVLAGQRPPLAAARAVGEVEASFEGRSALAQARERARAVLDMALELVADRARAEAGADPAELAHGDVLGGLAGAGAHRRRLETLLRARADVERNIDPATVLELAFAALAPPAYDRRARAGGGAARGRA